LDKLPEALKIDTEAKGMGSRNDVSSDALDEFNRLSQHNASLNAMLGSAADCGPYATLLNAIHLKRLNVSFRKEMERRCAICHSFCADVALLSTKHNRRFLA
jgi:hypothetical protein